MKRTIFWKIIAVVICAVYCLWCMTIYTFGYTQVDVERSTSLTLVFQPEETVFSDVKFALYHIAAVTDSADYRLNAAFLDSAISLQCVNADSWHKTTETLLSYIEKNNIAPLAEATTDADGIVTFSALQTGMYLIVGDACHDGPVTYTPVAFLKNLPTLEPERDTWDYDAVVKVKYTKQVEPEQAITPQTGDTNTTGRYILFTVCSIAGITVLCKKKKCQYNYK